MTNSIGNHKLDIKIDLILEIFLLMVLNSKNINTSAHGGIAWQVQVGGF
ncbi:MAG: hypothetical protein RQ936_11805 [Gammaproteobacteria bacterium]|nr:hypothetical protein [Gammaproteobacteria bacterium]